ncbi:MAG: 16S rRNA (cytosine(1402)-N(4))-methyltransferase RsmH [Methylohalobius sp.]|nr:16S rRNA (cytosine(1402)-N(4))-methyltransferase RsmH [Methylohalobius sp.]
MMDAIVHRPVMLEEALAGLAIRKDGVYVDCTFGRGGHSRAILDRLGPDGRLVALDKDPDAIASLQANILDQDARFRLIHADFARLKEVLQDIAYVGKINGILLDLGISSPQLDDPERGFSFVRDGPLDMRMDPTAGLSAARWLAQAGEREIAEVLWRCGEERFARHIARAVVRTRAKKPLTRTGQLARLVERCVPRREPGKHPATRTFLALRIHLNRELESLQAVLAQAAEVLAVGGRLVTIAFHSLEDRIVKRFIREVNGLHALGKSKPSPFEVMTNPRARSAILRVAERRC